MGGSLDSPFIDRPPNIIFFGDDVNSSIGSSAPHSTILLSGCHSSNSTVGIWDAVHAGWGVVALGGARAAALLFSAVDFG